MGQCRPACLCFLLLLITRTDAITGGSPASVCDFPGVAVVTGMKTEVLCTGVITEPGKSFYLPTFCGSFLNIAIRNTSLIVTNGFSKWNFQQSSVDKVVTADKEGRAMMVLEGKQTADDPETNCVEKFGTLYDGANEMLPQCQVGGWGSNTKDGGVPYKRSSFNKATVSKSSGVSCCKIITNTFGPKEGGVGIKYMDPSNCITADASPCGVGDIGAPVMCKTKAGTIETIGLTTNVHCKVGGGLFLIQDTTGALDSKIKFGYKMP